MSSINIIRQHEKAQREQRMRNSMIKPQVDAFKIKEYSTPQRGDEQNINDDQLINKKNLRKLEFIQQINMNTTKGKSCDKIKEIDSCSDQFTQKQKEQCVNLLNLIELQNQQTASQQNGEITPFQSQMPTNNQEQDRDQFYLDDEGYLMCEKLRVVDIARMVERSPFYLTSKKQIIKNYNYYYNALDGFNLRLIAYNFRLNNNFNVIKQFTACGAHAICQTSLQLRQAVKANFNHDKILYHANGKIQEDIHYAVEKRIHIKVDHLHGKQQLIQTAQNIGKRVRLVIKLDVNNIDKFKNQVRVLLPDKSFLIVTGVHCNLAKWQQDGQDFMENVKLIIQAIDELRQEGLDLKYINLTASKHYTSIENQINKTVSFILQVKELVQKANLNLMIEPGAEIVSNTSIFVNKIIGVEDAGEAGRKQIYLDGSISNYLHTNLVCGKYHQMEIVEPQTDGSSQLIDVFGTDCDLDDHQHRERRLINPKEGQYIAIHHVGSNQYTSTQSFEQQKAYPEYWTIGDKLYQIHERADINNHNIQYQLKPINPTVSPQRKVKNEYKMDLAKKAILQNQHTKMKNNMMRKSFVEFDSFTIDQIDEEDNEQNLSQDDDDGMYLDDKRRSRRTNERLYKSADGQYLNDYKNDKEVQPLSNSSFYFSSEKSSKKIAIQNPKSQEKNSVSSDESYDNQWSEDKNENKKTKSNLKISKPHRLMEIFNIKEQSQPQALNLNVKLNTKEIKQKLNQKNQRRQTSCLNQSSSLYDNSPQKFFDEIDDKPAVLKRDVNIDSQGSHSYQKSPYYNRFTNDQKGNRVLMKRPMDIKSQFGKENSLMINILDDSSTSLHQKELDLSSHLEPTIKEEIYDKTEMVGTSMPEEPNVKEDMYRSSKKVESRDLVTPVKFYTQKKKCQFQINAMKYDDGEQDVCLNRDDGGEVDMDHLNQLSKPTFKSGLNLTDDSPDYTLSNGDQNEIKPHGRTVALSALKPPNMDRKSLFGSLRQGNASHSGEVPGKDLQGIQSLGSAGLRLRQAPHLQDMFQKKLFDAPTSPTQRFNGGGIERLRKQTSCSKQSSISSKRDAFRNRLKQNGSLSNYSPFNKFRPSVNVDDDGQSSVCSRFVIKLQSNELNSQNNSNNDIDQSSMFLNQFEQQYTELDILGEGCSSVVKKCEHKISRLTRAVKIIRSDDDEYIEISKKEYYLINELKSNQIVKVYDCIHDEVKGTLYLIMEYIEGSTLEEFVLKHISDNKGYIKEDLIVKIVKQILMGIDCLHQNGVCHRDLKPDNVLINSKTKQIKLTDFNASKKFLKIIDKSKKTNDQVFSIFDDQSSSDSRSSNDEDCKDVNKQKIKKRKIALRTMTGLDQWSAPETRQGGEYSEIIDIWGVGCITYFMVAQHPPFLDHDEQRLIKKVQSCEYDDFSPECKQFYSQELLEFVKSLIVADPAKRPNIKECLQSSLFKKTGSPTKSLEFSTPTKPKELGTINGKSPQKNPETPSPTYISPKKQNLKIYQQKQSTQTQQTKLKQKQDPQRHPSMTLVQQVNNEHFGYKEYKDVKPDNRDNSNQTMHGKCNMLMDNFVVENEKDQKTKKAQVADQEIRMRDRALPRNNPREDGDKHKFNNSGKLMSYGETGLQSKIEAKNNNIQPFVLNQSVQIVDKSKNFQQQSSSEASIEKRKLPKQDKQKQKLTPVFRPIKRQTENVIVPGETIIIKNKEKEKFKKRKSMRISYSDIKEKESPLKTAQKSEEQHSSKNHDNQSSSVSSYSYESENMPIIRIKKENNPSSRKNNQNIKLNGKSKK